MRRNRTGLRGAILALLCPTVFACAGEPSYRDLILITVDTLRPDHMGIYGYDRDITPELDRFFADGAVFERAYSTEANTSPSVVSLLTGLLPHEHRVRLLMQRVPDDLGLLPDLLPDSYLSAAFVSNGVLTDGALGMADRFDHYDDFVDERVPGIGPVFERNARRTTNAALRFLRLAPQRERPLFLWIHYIDPHSPYAAPDRESRDLAGKPSAGLAPPPRSPSARDWEMVDLYDAEIAYMDAEIGRLLEGYAALAPIDAALVIFTADHGESMMEHERWFSHGYHVYEEIVRVPLLVRGPGVRAGRFTGLASGIDIAPTLLSAAGGELPAGSRGVDLRRGGSIDPERIVFAEATWSLGHWRAAIGRDRKWMLGSAQGEREIRERRVYDLGSDPAEREPLPMRDAEPAAAALLTMLQTDPDPGGIPVDLKSGMLPQAPKVSPRATRRQLEQLRALGYVE